MSRPVLGATLYIPANRYNLAEVLHDKALGLRSAVICLEDAVAERELDAARSAFADYLTRSQPDCRVYARPRDLTMLGWMLDLPGIERIDGFVLPKVTSDNVGSWLAMMLGTDHAIMPTIEGEEAFNLPALQTLRGQLTPFSRRVDCVRIGGNDILNILGARRSRSRTAYDGPLGQVIRNMAATFIPAGFQVSAPVFEHFDSTSLLAAEIECDLEHGLLTKTAIHPAQVRQIHKAYSVSVDELTEARAILDEAALAVFGSAGSMCEPATHRTWAANVLARAQVFGVRPDTVVSIKVA
jgi:citrate lyase beta subunit